MSELIAECHRNGWIENIGTPEVPLHVFSGGPVMPFAMRAIADELERLDREGFLKAAEQEVGK